MIISLIFQINNELYNTYYIIHCHIINITIAILLVPLLLNSVLLVYNTLLHDVWLHPLSLEGVVHNALCNGTVLVSIQLHTYMLLGRLYIYI